ncbi:MAG: phosphate butyryltransferase [Candidatus Riflebacteria bacterium]|nr:phosphate butyryltransferase [Candidatus Riflebacteria bacterium]
MSFQEIEKKLLHNKVNLAVCMPEDANSLTAAKDATYSGYVNCILVGSPNKIRSILDEIAPEYSPEIVAAETPEEAAAKSVELVKTGKAAALMKGTISTPILLKAVLNKDTGIRQQKILSHVLIFEHNSNLKFLTDGGMIPEPTLEQKAELINNAKHAAQKLGIDIVRVAVLAAENKVDLSNEHSCHAAILAQMSKLGQFGEDCIIEGPMTLDVAMFPEIASQKSIFNEVAGKADILLTSDIDTGNVLGKSLIYHANTLCAGLIIGASCPIILLSRADSDKVKLNSIKTALAIGA